MGTELQRTQPTALAVRETVATIKSRVQLVQQVMREVMKEDVHYGIIPGTKQRTLYKPGAEIIALAFGFAPTYTIDDLSGPDTIRYRVSCQLCSRDTGTVVGSGQGEASSDEDKYRWRRAVCKEEFEAAPEDRRRIKWAKGKGGSTYTIEQVRMEPADIANTVLKMAEKRAFVDAIRTTSGCSDMFAQDLEDMPPEVRHAVGAAEEPSEPEPPVGEKDWKKLVKVGERFGYAEADILATAATAGYEGPGPGIPGDLAQRLFAAMKSNPKLEAPAAPEPAAEDSRGYPTPLRAEGDD